MTYPTSLLNLIINPQQQEVKLATPRKASQPPTGNPKPGASPNPQPGNPSSTAPSSKSPGTDDRVQEAAMAQLAAYLRKYPGSKPFLIQLNSPYPTNTPCPKTKRSDYIIYIPVFGKTPKNRDTLNDPISANVEEAKVFAEDNKDNEALIKTAMSLALEATNYANKNRAAADKDLIIIYSIRLQFDSKTCNSKG